MPLLDRAGNQLQAPSPLPEDSGQKPDDKATKPEDEVILVPEPH